MIDRALTLAELALTIVGLAVPFIFPKIPTKGAWVSFALGIGLLAIATGIALVPEGRAQTTQASSQIGDNNTLLNVPMPNSMGSGNTIIGPNLPNGDTVYTQPGTAIGAGACAGNGIAIGAGPNTGGCQRR